MDQVGNGGAYRTEYGHVAIGKEDRLPRAYRLIAWGEWQPTTTVAPIRQLSVFQCSYVGASVLAPRLERSNGGRLAPIWAGSTFSMPITRTPRCSNSVTRCSIADLLSVTADRSDEDNWRSDKKTSCVLNPLVDFGDPLDNWRLGRKDHSRIRPTDEGRRSLWRNDGRHCHSNVFPRLLEQHALHRAVFLVATSFISLEEASGGPRHRHPHLSVSCDYS